jgi:hypothetical protein
LHLASEFLEKVITREGSFSPLTIQDNMKETILLLLGAFMVAASLIGLMFWPKPIELITFATGGWLYLVNWAKVTEK